MGMRLHFREGIFSLFSHSEMTRARLNQFINHIQSAIAALAGPVLAL